MKHADAARSAFSCVCSMLDNKEDPLAGDSL